MQFTAFAKATVASAVLACSAWMPQSAAAAVQLYAAPWISTPYGVPADAAFGPGTTSATLTGQGTITSLTWWGIYDVGTPADDSFIVSLNSSTLNGSVTPSSAGSVQVPDVGSVDVYRYVFALDAALPYTSGTVEISIVNGDDPDNPVVFWFWLDSGTNLDPDIFPPSSLVIEGTREGTVPEPDTLALFAAAGGLLFVARRRAKRQA